MFAPSRTCRTHLGLLRGSPTIRFARTEQHSAVSIHCRAIRTIIPFAEHATVPVTTDHRHSSSIVLIIICDGDGLQQPLLSLLIRVSAHCSPFYYHRAHSARSAPPPPSAHCCNHYHHRHQHQHQQLHCNLNQRLYEPNNSSKKQQQQQKYHHNGSKSPPLFLFFHLRLSQFCARFCLSILVCVSKSTLSALPSIWCLFFCSFCLFVGR